MPYQNDMMSLADIVGPAYAAQQAGIQNDLANQQEQVKAQIAQATMPQEIQRAQLQNQLLGAQGQAEQGIAAQQLAAGNTAMQAQPSAAQAQIGGNQAKISAAHLDQMNNLGQIVGQISSYMENVPPPARPAMMAQILDQNNVNDPAIRQAVASGDPQQLQALSQHLFDVSNAARADILKGTIQGQNQANVANIEGGYKVQVAEQSAEARKYAADQKARIDQLKQTTDQAIAQLSGRIGSPQEQPGDRERLQFLSQQQALVRQMQAQNAQQLLNLGTPAPMLNIPQSPQGAAPQQNNSAPAGGGNIDPGLAAEMQRRGLLK